MTSAPMLLVMMMMALRKSTMRPRASERWPSSMIWSSMLKASGMRLLDLVEDDDAVGAAADAPR
jgi:hypothetical protein